MKRQRALNQVGLILIGLVVFFWTILPLYHMLVMALTPTREAFAGRIWPREPTLENFITVFTQNHFFLRLFWTQLYNSLFVAIMTVLIVLTIGMLASFAIARLRPRWGNWVSNAALLTYVIPASFLAIPFYQIMVNYGFINNRWALIFAMITFATPYAIWVLRGYAESIPYELDEAAKVDGATTLQILRIIYFPLMTPALVAVGTYALLLAWNEYLYAFLLLSSENRVTLPIAMGFFLATDDAPWNLLMATALIYAIPPALLYYAVRRYMVTGLTTGGVKG
jgi:multiple sugar transport system permease protein